MSQFIRTRYALALVAGILLAGSATGSNTLRTVAWAGGAPQETLKPDMVLTEKNNGKTEKAKVGNLIEVRLESDATTGYEWTITTQDKEALESVGKPKFIAPTGGMDGAPGQQVFQFKTRKKGATRLELQYARPFETGKAPAQTYVVTIDVE